MDFTGAKLCVKIDKNTVPPVLRLSGEADFHNKGEIYDALNTLIDAGYSTIRADLSNLNYADSSAIATLVKCASRIRETGGTFELTGVSRQVAKALTQCGAALFFKSQVQDLPIDGKESGQQSGQDFWRVASFSLPASPEAASIARRRVADIVESLPLTSSDSSDVIAAFGEAVANAIRHGCGCNAERRISIRCVAGPSALAIDVCDPGPGFAPEDVPTPTPQSAAEGGMGIHIMRGLMDKVEFFFGERTITRLVKHIASAHRISRG